MVKKNFTLEEWRLLYKDELEFILEAYIDCVNCFSSDDYVCYINMRGLREELADIIYRSSVNRSKAFMLGF